jgi:hypothetical protein
MHGHETEPAEKRVRRALARPPAHSVNAGLARMSRPRIIALAIGIGAALAAVAAATAILLNTDSSPRFPSGPTAEKITVSRTPADPPEAVVTPP